MGIGIAAGFPIMKVADSRQEFSFCWVGIEVGIFALIHSDEVLTVEVDPGVAFFMTLAEHVAGADGGEDFLLDCSNGYRVFAFGCSFDFNSQGRPDFLFEQDWRGLSPRDLLCWDFEFCAPIIEDALGLLEKLCFEEPVAGTLEDEMEGIEPFGREDGFEPQSNGDLSWRAGVGADVGGVIGGLRIMLQEVGTHLFDG